MENKKKSKSKILIMLFAIILLVVGASFAIWHYSYSGTEENVLSSPDLSLRFLESNNEVISIDNGVPMKDEDGIKQSGTGNVFDFEVKSKALMDTDVSYDINLEKLSIDSGKTALSDSDIKVYVEDFNGNTVLKPTKVSDLSNYKLFTKVHRHSKSNNEISTKYKLKVWIDENVDVFSLEGKQYKFRVGVSTNQKEQDKNQTYSLVYNLDGGTGSITDSTFKVGDKVTISSTVPVKAGYKFLGWSTKKSASSASYKAGDSVTLNDAYDGKVTLYAVWQGKTYTVKYDSNGGTGSMDDSVFKLATDVKLSNNKFSKENYTFIGWSTSKGGEVTYTNEAKVKDLGGEGDIVTLYAVWKSNTYTIKYDSNGGNGFVGESSYNYGNSIKLTKNKFTKDGYTFIGWNTNKDANAALYTDEQEVSGLSGNITLYAVWKVNEYNVNVTVQNGTVDVANKKVIEKQNGVFNLTPSNSNYKDASVSCTNDQTGIVKNNILTVSNVTKDTVCTVTYYSLSTVLYSDGTLILNEMSTDRSKNITTHSSVTKEYAPMDESNSYVMDYYTQPWADELSEITRVEIGSKMKPTSTAYWFAEMVNLTYGDFTNLDTSNVIDMEEMFANESGGEVVNSYKLVGLDSWDVSKVTNMDMMFDGAGSGATDVFDIGNLSNWDVSSVTDMSMMFSSTGLNATTWSIGDLSKWNTSSVINMWHMFSNTGSSTKTWSIGNLSNWNTSNVTDMGYMFDSAGQNATIWDIGNLSNWNTSNVTDMRSMFYRAGSSATTWNIGNLSNWDVSRVTNMSGMFNEAGRNATTWDIGDLSNWNTSNVTDMNMMFYRAGSSATTWNIGNLSNWNTSKVTDMRYMFTWAGEHSEIFSLDLSNWDISKVTNMDSMFSSAGVYSTKWIVKIPKKTGDLDNNVNKLYGSSDSIYAKPPSIERKFTIEYDVNVNIQEGVLANGESSKKIGSYDDNVSFNIVPDDSSKAGFVDCTNNQNGFLSNNVLTIKNIMSDTTCTITFDTASTVLYTDGTLILNELVENRNSGISEHGDVIKEYYAMSDSNSYDFSGGNPWTAEVNDVKNVEIGSKMIPLSTSRWFEGMGSIEYGDFTKLITSYVVDMESMFAYAGGAVDSEFKLVGLENWNTSKIKSMHGMFYGAGSSANTWSIGDLSNWNFSSIEEMASMFEGAGNSATEFNSIGRLNFTDLNYNIEVNAFAVESPNFTADILIDEPYFNDISNIFSGSVMADNARVTIYYDSSNPDLSDLVTDIINNFGPTSSNQGNIYMANSVFTTLYNDGTFIINELYADRKVNIDSHGKLIKEYDSLGENNTYNFSLFSDRPWNSEVSLIKNVQIGSKISPTSTAYWFYNCLNMKLGDFKNLNTSNVNNMDSMFESAGYNADTFELSGLETWDTSRVTNMNSMFADAGYGTRKFELKGLENWNTSKVTNMGGMFNSTGYNAYSFTINKLNNWDTSSVTNMNSMFQNAGYSSTVWSIGSLATWDVNNVKNAMSMFLNAGYSATSFDLGNLDDWNVYQLTYGDLMFSSAGYKAYKFNIGDLSHWDVSNVKNLKNFFLDTGKSSKYTPPSWYTA